MFQKRQPCSNDGVVAASMIVVFYGAAMSLSMMMGNWESTMPAGLDHFDVYFFSFSFLNSIK